MPRDTALNATYAPPIEIAFHVEGEGNTINIPEGAFDNLVKDQNTTGIGEKTSLDQEASWYSEMSKTESVLAFGFVLIFIGVMLYGAGRILNAAKPIWLRYMHNFTMGDNHK